MYSREKMQNARLRLALSPAGGSLVSLMARASRPTGMPLLGSDDTKSRKRECEPSSAKVSSFFSSSMSHRG